VSGIGFAIYRKKMASKHALPELLKEEFVSEHNPVILQS